MTKTDFAELKEKLVRFDEQDEGAFRYYADMCSDKIMDSHKAYQEGAYYQNSKSAAIITELLEIIQSQSEALEKIQEYDSVPTYVRVQYKAVLTTDFVNKTLSETTTRLQKLREGK